MSLLMDALKKAEQEKKEAAKRLKEAEEQAGNESQELSLEERPEQSGAESEEEPETVDLASDANASEETSTSDAMTSHPASAKEKINADSLSLSPVSDDTMAIESEIASTADSPSEENINSTQNLNLSSLSLADDDANETASGLSQTLSLSDSAEEEITTVQADVTIQDKELYDAMVASSDTVASDTVASETFADDSDEYFSATVSAAQLAEDIGGDSPTPVAAQTVFTASSTTRSGSQITQWVVFGIICIAIAISLSFLIFNYTIPVERSVTSPLVAKDIEIQAEPIPVINIPENLVSEAEMEAQSFSGEITEVIENESKLIDEGEQEINSVSEENNISENDIDEQNITDVRTKEQEEIWYPEDTETDIDLEPAVAELPQSLPETIEVEPTLIKISRNKSIDSRDVLINLAYQDYLAGDYRSAEKSYQDVLKELPENRDALLGLAAIAMRSDQIAQAYEYYLKVLKLYPGDSTAEAALINFQQNSDHMKSESILKSYIKKEPKNAFLHYSLGQVYAATDRWAQAQQSFFNAYSIDNTNPDYAFNLAVSLDHIEQWQPARTYYQTALDIINNTNIANAGSQSFGFDKSVVRTRINELSNLASIK